VSAPVDSATVERPWLRLSTRMLLVHVVTDVARAIPAVLGLLVAGSSTGQGPVWSLVATGIAVLTAVTRWVTTRYRITAAQVQLRTGLLRRRRMTVPLDRVRTVDVQATPMHRLVGLNRVRLGTGRSDTERERHLTLDGLTAGQVDWLRREVLHRPASDVPHPADAAAAAGAPDSSDSAVVELARLDPAWIRYGPFTLTGLVTVVAVAGLTWRIGNEAHVDPERYPLVRDARHYVTHTAVGLLAVQAVIGLAVLVAVLSTAGYVLAFWHFRLVRTAEGTVHVSRGLLTTRAVTIEDRRLRGVELSEPLLLRLARGARLIAVATGLRVGRGAERGGGILLPPAPRETAVSVAAQVCRTAAPFRAGLRSHPRRALSRRITRAALAIAVLAVMTGWLVVEGLPGAVATVVAVPATALIPIAVDRYRSLGHGLVDQFLVVAEGTVVRRRVALHSDAVIGWTLRSSLFQRRAGLTTLIATTACGRQHYRALDIAATEAVPFAMAVTPGLLDPFLVGSVTEAVGA
jgi:putative membrane protein